MHHQKQCAAKLAALLQVGAAVALASMAACGSEPTPPDQVSTDPDASHSELQAPDSILLPGDTMTVFVRARDAAGRLVERGGATVTFRLENGTSTASIGNVVDLGTGSYRTLLTGVASGTTSSIAATLNDAPVPATARLRVAAFATISAAWQHTCATLTGGIGFCWGLGNSGQLGDGSKEDSALPQRVTGGLRFITIEAGVQGQTCGLTTAGAGYCWGNSGAGALGNGVADMGSGTNLESPSPVAGGHVFTRLAVGGGLESCGLTNGPAVLCWGSNSIGALGDGTLTSRNVPTPVMGQPALIQIGMGQTHTCGAAAAGTIFCWGSNFFGELGVDPATGPSDCNGSPCSLVPVIAAAGSPLEPATLAVGTNHACALTGTGAAYCWGLASNGELGDGVQADFSITPVAVAGGHQFTQLAAGNRYTCGVATDASAYCWGANTSDRLGSGPGDAATPRAVEGGLHFVSLDAGEINTCGVATDGWGYCWGDNTWGQLGDGSVAPRSAPVRVAARLR
jgi:alpha-tubulin suppressor-like RCC1 family protein